MATETIITVKLDDTRITELRKQKREINKEIKSIKNESKMEEALVKWKAMDKIKKEFSSKLTEHKITLKKLTALPDYYTFVEINGTRKALVKTEEWIKKALAKGANEAEMIKKADTMKEKYVRKQLTPKKRKKTKKTLLRSLSVPAKKKKAAQVGGVV